MTTVEEQPTAEMSSAELNLLLEWPHERRSYWAGVIAATLAVHALVLLGAVNLPSFVDRSEAEQPVVVHRIPLYIPRDILTQKAPNRRKVSKQIDLADLLASQQLQARAAAPRPSVKRFEMPKQAVPQRAFKANPQILPEAPQVAINQPQGPPPPGAANGITAPPPPAPPAQPFQNVGTEAAPPNPHPTLAPPKNGVQAAINVRAQSGNSNRQVVTDDNSSEPTPGAPGSIGRAGAKGGAVELLSDPQGADFKAYLTRVLAIVRPKWRSLTVSGVLRGRTVIEFSINRDGSIPKMVIADPSGSATLDLAAVNVLSKAPLPPLPADYKGLQVRVALTFDYNMPSR
jgi:TonB family protein